MLDNFRFNAEQTKLFVIKTFYVTEDIFGIRERS